jgi:transaldolase
VTERHVVGVTTNPTIFARAITGSNAGSPPTVSLGNSHGDG